MHHPKCEIQRVFLFQKEMQYIKPYITSYMTPGHLNFYHVTFQLPKPFGQKWSKGNFSFLPEPLN